MRRMVAPGVWRDEGPGAAIHASSRARIETGRLIGQMVPEPSAGPNPLWAKRSSDPAVIAHQERRKAERREKRAAG